MKRLLVLRPQPGASATAERARSLGLDPALIPLFEIEPLEWTAADPAGFDALLLTSANAVRFGGDELKSLLPLPVHAVGAATAEAACEAGFRVSSVGEAGVDALLDSLDPKLKLLHLGGDHRKAPGAARQAIRSIAVYRSHEIEAPDVGEAGDAVALIHSPRSGARFAQLVRDRGSIAIAAISQAAAQAAGTGWQRVEWASRPNDDALLALAAELCNNLSGT
jgi:uroporphyrinogen-III synthase